MRSDRFAQEAVDLLCQLPIVSVVECRRRLHLPVALDPHLSVLAEHHMAGEKLSDPANNAEGGGDVAQGEVIVQGLQVQLRLKAGREQSPQL